MKAVNKIVLAVAVISLTFVSYGFTAIPASGTNGKVQWRQVSKYQLPYNPVDIAHSLDGNYAFILTDNNKVLVYDRRGQVQGIIPVEAGVSAIDIDPQGNYLYLIDGKNKIASTIAVDFVVNINTANAPFKGEVNAPVTIAVFSDFQ